MPQAAGEVLGDTEGVPLGFDRSCMSVGEGEASDMKYA